MTSTQSAIGNSCVSEIPDKRGSARSGQKSAILPGWVNTYYRSYKGRKLGPYHVRRWKVGRKIHREYIKPDDVERVKAACQAHREKQRSDREGARAIHTFIDNWAFMARQIFNWEKGKYSTPAQYAYLDRLNKEGMYITGRPPVRRTIKRTIAEVAGETMIVSTVYELDGTTRVFMVPLKINKVVDRFKTVAERFREIAMEAWQRVHGTPLPDTQHPIPNTNAQPSAV